MVGFLTIFFIGIAVLLTVQAMDVECARQRGPRRRLGFGRGLARGMRAPLRVPFRNMLQSQAR